MAVLVFAPLIIMTFYIILVKDELEGIFVINGEIGQAKYLVLLIISHLFTLSLYAVINRDDAIVIILIWTLFSIFLIVSSGIRRLRDIGWNSFLILVPFVYLIIIFIPSKNSTSSELKNLEKKVKIARLKKELEELNK